MSHLTAMYLVGNVWLIAYLVFRNDRPRATFCTIAGAINVLAMTVMLFSQATR